MEWIYLSKSQSSSHTCKSSHSISSTRPRPSASYGSCKPREALSRTTLDYTGTRSLKIFRVLPSMSNERSKISSLLLPEKGSPKLTVRTPRCTGIMGCPIDVKAGTGSPFIAGGSGFPMYVEAGRGSPSSSRGPLKKKGPVRPFNDKGELSKMEPTKQLFSAMMGIPSKGPTKVEPIVLEWLSSVGAFDGKTSNPATQTIIGEVATTIRGSTSSLLASSSTDRQGLFQVHLLFFPTPDEKDANAAGVLGCVEFLHQRKKVSYEGNQ
ncbi:hypothetical protein ACLOJK_007249 [Asimina triloba]